MHFLTQRSVGYNAWLADVFQPCSLALANAVPRLLDLR
jgi:hypothetical protein